MSNQIENKTVKPAEILHEEEGLRLVRLEFAHLSSYSGTHEVLAHMGVGLVVLNSVNFDKDKKPKRFALTPTQMDTLAAAWLQFRSDQADKEAAAKAEYEAEITTLMDRAVAIGGRIVRDDENDDFLLTWPAHHPMYHRYQRDDCLSVYDLKSRLNHAESEIKAVQEGRIKDGAYKVTGISGLIDRAVKVDAFVSSDSDDHDDDTKYALIFSEGHPLHGFWRQWDGLTLGHLEYRLRYAEGLVEAGRLKVPVPRV